MFISCNRCNTKYKLDDALVRKSGIKARCGKCNNVFVVRRTTPQNSAAESTTRSAIEHSSRYGEDDNSNCEIITICNQKGGVAKTTTCMNLGASLASMSKKVLLVDFDIQANLSLLLGYKDTKSFFDVIHSDGGELSNYIKNTKYGFSLLPSSSKMALLSKKHLSNDNFEYMLRDKLRSVKHSYDYILIDTPPSGDFYTLNALLASNIAIIPTQCEYLSLNGVNHIEGMINVINEKIRHDIDFHILITMFDQGQISGDVIFQKLKDNYPGRVFKTVIHKDPLIQESQIVHTPILEYSHDSDSGHQYRELANEVISISTPEEKNERFKAYS